MGTPGYRGCPTPAWNPAAATDFAEADEFLRLFHRENSRVASLSDRLATVRSEIERTGTYVHTGDELAYGAKVAWRNASRCIGRLYWRNLLVLDRRQARSPEATFGFLLRHLEIASGIDTRGGQHAVDRPIRPVISIFSAAVPGRPYTRVWNEQLIRYAGYREPDGSILGDPAQEQFTVAMQALGWKGGRTAFDVLPVVVETPEHGASLFELPEQLVVEVPLVHPEFDWFADLGLRWHAVPIIANQRLNIGGVNYPFAPFNGWYLGTEIGARNLGDPNRYNVLPTVARLLNLDTTAETTLWRDRALVEVNRAVLHSFDRAGFKITDHHTEAARFLEHVKREENAGRPVPADWTWIVPPMSGSATPVFHRYFHEADQRPNFYLDEPARRIARTGQPDS